MAPPPRRWRPSQKPTAPSVSVTEAAEAAHAALLRDPRSFKARYRRAMGRKGLRLFPECLLDLASALTTEPGNADVNREFDAVETICRMERRLLNSEDITAADYPPAFGAESRSAEQLPTPSVHIAATSTPPPRRGTSADGALEICFACRAKKPRKQCKAVKYCSLTCQRADWPEHKTRCKLASDNHVTVRLGRTLSQHQYFSIHLLLYSIRAMGLTTSLLNYQRFILLVVVEMVPIVPPAPPGGLTQRLAIRQLLSVPITSSLIRRTGMWMPCTGTGSPRMGSMSTATTGAIGCGSARSKDDYWRASTRYELFISHPKSFIWQGAAFEVRSRVVVAEYGG
ncbi:hypothetical protein B0H13DRAFT_2417618 [Mycena leptocephala]|nr:hypothetical protein B0H13DRAFT_2417618 [Mycena leptocephala]